LGKSLIGIAAVTCLSVASPAAAFAQAKSGYVTVNGLRMYYEVHGTRRPLPKAQLAVLPGTTHSTFSTGRRTFSCPS
jgi:hypothetical protein